VQSILPMLFPPQPPGSWHRPHPVSSIRTTACDLPRLILSGTVARQDEGFRVLVQLLDLSAGQYVASVAFDVAAQAPGHAERIAAERIIAQLNGLVAAG
jgi:TolB-like protein